MKNYTITVNGNVYDVTVEEGTSAGSAAAPVVSAATPKAPVAPVAAPKAPAAPAKKSTGAGSIHVEAGAAGHRKTERQHHERPKRERETTVA